MNNNVQQQRSNMMKMICSYSGNQSKLISFPICLLFFNILFALVPSDVTCLSINSLCNYSTITGKRLEVSHTTTATSCIGTICLKNYRYSTPTLTSRPITLRDNCKDNETENGQDCQDSCIQKMNALTWPSKIITNMSLALILHLASISPSFAVINEGDYVYYSNSESTVMDKYTLCRQYDFTGSTSTGTRTGAGTSTSSIHIAATSLADDKNSDGTLQLEFKSQSEPKSVKEMAQVGGKWFFIIYVVFSFVAGAVEMTKRFQTWLDKRT